ncbi:MAG: ATP-dependent Clp protease proteolytic subunit [bacterium]|nr:ATP-dependent Clp protease proteolytic subunit [bacterium]
MGENLNPLTNQLDAELLDNRVIFLEGEIDTESVNKIIKQLIILQHRNKKKPVHLMINSPGGSVYDMFALYDAIQTSDAPIHTYAWGSTMSAAAIILLSGTSGCRHASENSRIMLHEISDWIEQDSVERFSESKTRLEESKKLMEMILKIVRKHTKIKKSDEQLLKEFEKDVYISAVLAKELGIVDHVIRN